MEVCPICTENPAASPHHIKPRAEGGTDEKKNVVYLCRRCHDIVESMYDQTGVEYSPWLVKEIKRDYGFTGGAPEGRFGLKVFSRKQPFGGGYHKPTPVRDTKTGEAYPSRAALGRTLAPGYNLNPQYPYVYYILRRMFPMRFVNV